MAIKQPLNNTKELVDYLKIPEENYIYFYHTNEKFVIPVDPDAVSDSMSASFASNTPLSRSAPIYSYQNSGPRVVSVNFTLHRDLNNQFNPKLAKKTNEDATELLITNLDKMVLPDYNSAGKIVNPPIVALKLRDDIYIKGIVTQTSHTYQLPIIEYGGKSKYAVVGLNFSVSEITPYSASILPKVGQFRNTSGISKSTYKANTSTGTKNTGNAKSNAVTSSNKSSSGRGGGLNTNSNANR